MMSETNIGGDESYEEDSCDEQGRPAERWAPLGAAAGSPVPHEFSRPGSEEEALRQLEEEQEQLNSSLLALTTHFAQVQFRLKQIVNAPNETREELLKELEEFAFRGIPDVRGSKIQDAQIMEELTEQQHEMKLSEQRQKQLELIEQLKAQLEDLEVYAYETGHDQLPTTTVMEKQRVVIDQLKTKLNLEMDDFDKLSTEELRAVVDNAIGQIVNPAKVKSKLVEQLKTQITDLERFISFIQKEGDSERRPACTCNCPVHGQTEDCDPSCEHGKGQAKRWKDIERARKQQERTRSRATLLMKRAMTLLQIFAVSQFGCGGQEFQRNVLKRTPKGNHYGDLLAKLELAISHLVEVAKVDEERATHAQDSDYTSDSEDVFHTSKSSVEVTTAVRKELSPALRDLLQHGLMEIGQSTSLVPWGCLPSRSQSTQKMMHAWDLFLRYYEMKHGREYNESPARKLSQAFDLDMVGGKAITTKQTLLGAVDTILTSHNPLKRTEDSKFKAFVSMGLNEKRLSTWIKLVVKNTTIVDYYYQPWSYVARTGFDDACKSLSRLDQFTFDLPIDQSVRQFRNIKDAF